MITRVTLRYFKRFEEQTFDLLDSIVLAGPNNSGKSTLLQALAVWNLAIQRWRTEKGIDGNHDVRDPPGTGTESLRARSGETVVEDNRASRTPGDDVDGPRNGQRSKPRPGVPISRKDFTAVPLRDLDLLWYDRRTAYRKNEGPEGTKPGAHKLIRIGVEGRDEHEPWQLAFEFRYQSPELLYAIPAADHPYSAVAEVAKRAQVVHVPPFSGIGSEETRYDRPYQDLLIGQGKPGDILRNLLLEVHDDNPDVWPALVDDIEALFGYQLLDPSYEGRPFIACEYVARRRSEPKAGAARFDIASAGSGFHQVLMLLGFFYARKASVLLLDEPDAHQHVFLQKQVYDKLRAVARRRGCQLIIATHAEVILDATAPEQIVSFYQEPHRLDVDKQRDQVREATKRLSSTEILLAEERNGIIYTEGASDLDILREWAKVLKHRAHGFLVHPLWHSNHGRNPREAREHLFALQAVRPNIPGVLLLDGDNRGLPDHELRADNLKILRWNRYEIENYLIVPTALERFSKEQACGALFGEAASNRAMDYLRKELPPAVLNDPLGNHDYLVATAASKSILPGFFQAAGVRVSRDEYYQIAAVMKKGEIHDEIREKLDAIASALRL